MVKFSVLRKNTPFFQIRSPIFSYAVEASLVIYISGYIVVMGMELEIDVLVDVISFSGRDLGLSLRRWERF